MRRNDIKCSHIVTNVVKVFPYNDCMPVNLDTPYDDLYEVAKRDSNEFEVLQVLGHKGNPLIFLILFEDDTDPIFVPFNADVIFNDEAAEYIDYNLDLQKSIAFKDYCNSVPILKMLLIPQQDVKAHIKTLDALIPDDINVNDIVYINIRVLGNILWYQRIGLPNADSVHYVIKGKITKISKKQIMVTFDNHYYEPISLSGSQISWYLWNYLFPITMGFIEVDEDLFNQYPNIRC